MQLVDRGTYTDGMEDNAEHRWETICVDHGGVCSHETRKLARSFMAAPEEWCEDCSHGPGTLDGTRERDWPEGILSRVSREAYDAITRSRAFDHMTPQEREAAALSYDRLPR